MVAVQLTMTLRLWPIKSKSHIVTCMWLHSDQFSTSFMYVLSANATRVDVLSLNAPGQAQNIQKLDIAGPAKAANLTVSKSQFSTLLPVLEGG
jgi:hypothetical protein